MFKQISLGGSSTAIGRAARNRKSVGGKHDAIQYVQLKDELERMVKTNQTRQTRLIEMEMGKNEMESKYTALHVKYQEVRKERDSALRSVAEANKKIRHLQAALRRSIDKEKTNDKTVTALLTQLRSDGLKTIKHSHRRRLVDVRDKDDNAKLNHGSYHSSSSCEPKNSATNSSICTDDDDEVGIFFCW